MQFSPFKFLPKTGTGFAFKLHMIRQISKKAKFLLFFIKFYPTPNVISIHNGSFILTIKAKIKFPDNEHDGLGGILGKIKPMLLLTMPYLRHNWNVSICILVNLHEINGLSGIIVISILVNKYVLIVGHCIRFCGWGDKTVSQSNIFRGLTRARNYSNCYNNMESTTTITMDQMLSPGILPSSLSQSISKCN